MYRNCKLRLHCGYSGAEEWTGSVMSRSRCCLLLTWGSRSCNAHQDPVRGGDTYNMKSFYFQDQSSEELQNINSAYARKIVGEVKSSPDLIAGPVACSTSTGCFKALDKA